MTDTRICAQIEILRDDVAYRLPACANIAGRAPGAGDVRSPCSGERPAADVQTHIGATSCLDCVRNLGVTSLFFKMEAASSAVIDLEEVEAEFRKVKLAVCRVVSIKTSPYTRLVATIACAGVRARVGICSRLHSERMDTVHRALHSVRKALGVEAKPSVRTVPVKEAIVDVHIYIPGVLESIRRHRSGHADNDLL